MYRLLALGWTGTPRQHRRLDIAIAIMAVLVIPIAVSVHTVVSWVFAMTVQPMWHSTIFGPYFVVGAIFSGIAALLLAMALIRKVYHLEEYLKPIHFNYLGILLLVMTLLWFYFTFAEYITTYYGHEPDEMAVFWAKINGPYWPFFWAMVFFNFAVPFVVLANRWTRTVAGTVVASTSVIIGMWLERFTIVVPTLVNPRLPWPRGVYYPSWVEVAITAGAFALFVLFYMLFTKFFPIISIWEVREGRERGLREVEERIRGYLPGAVRVKDGVGVASSARSGGRRSWLGLSVLCLGLGLASSAGAASPFTPLGNPHKGQQLFESKGCIRCHQVDGKGGKVGPDLSRAGAHRHLLQLAGLLWNHSPQMTARMNELGIRRPTFTGPEISDLVAYLYFIGFFDPPADTERGRAVFTNKGCIRCHAVNGAGGTIGPDLAWSEAILSPVEAARLMWNHAPFMEERMKKLGISWPLFEGDEMADLLAYLTSFLEVRGR